jgi:hypothetical protein
MPVIVILLTVLLRSPRMPQWHAPHHRPATANRLVAVSERHAGLIYNKIPTARLSEVKTHLHARDRSWDITGGLFYAFSVYAICTLTIGLPYV